MTTNNSSANKAVDSTTFYSLEDFGLFLVKGADAEKLLQGQLTTNPANIDAKSLSLSAICNPQGRCIGLFWITKLDQDFAFILPKDNIANCIQHLQKYAVFYKTEIVESTEVSIALLEHQSAEWTFTFPIRPLKTDDESAYLGICLLSAADHDFIDHADLVKTAAKQDGLAKLTSLGFPWLNEKASGQFLPHYLDLPALGGVDFKKGCFTGQEVIARMQYKGKLKSHMQRLSAEQALNLTPADKLFVEQKSAGEIICSAADSHGITYVLAIIKDNFLNTQIFQLQPENPPILKLLQSN